VDDRDRGSEQVLGGASNKRLERTRHEQASLLSCVGEPLKRSVGALSLAIKVDNEIRSSDRMRVNLLYRLLRKQ